MSVAEFDRYVEKYQAWKNKTVLHPITSTHAILWCLTHYPDTLNTIAALKCIAGVHVTSVQEKCKELREMRFLEVSKRPNVPRGLFFTLIDEEASSVGAESAVIAARRQKVRDIIKFMREEDSQEKSVPHSAYEVVPLSPSRSPPLSPPPSPALPLTHAGVSPLLPPERTSSPTSRPTQRPLTTAHKTHTRPEKRARETTERDTSIRGLSQSHSLDKVVCATMRTRFSPHFDAHTDALSVARCAALWGSPSLSDANYRVLAFLERLDLCGSCWVSRETGKESERDAQAMLQMKSGLTMTELSATTNFAWERDARAQQCVVRHNPLVQANHRSERCCRPSHLCVGSLAQREKDAALCTALRNTRDEESECTEEESGYQRESEARRARQRLSKKSRESSTRPVLAVSGDEYLSTASI